MTDFPSFALIISLAAACLLLLAYLRSTRGKLRRSEEQAAEIIANLRHQSGALQLSELRFRSLFENAAIGMIVLDSEGRILEANQALGDFLGYHPQELSTLSVKEVSHPDDRDETETLYRQVRQGSRDLIEYEKRYLRKDGTEVWGFVSIRWLKNENGRAGHGIAILIDIDERRRAEERLRRSEENSQRLSREYQVLLDGIRDPLLLLTPELNVVWANRSAAESCGRTPEEIRGLACHQICLNRAAACPECVARRTLADAAPASGRISAPDGRVWDIRTFPIHDKDGKVVKVIEHSQNITETLRLQEEAARSAHLASLGELAAGVAHEINNPINGIINYAQLLGDKLAADSREKEMTARIIREGERIATIVRNLLSFARMRPEQKTRVSVCEVLLDAYVLVEAQLRKDGTEVVLDLPPHLPEILAHGQQLQQVFLNLASNARYALNEKYPGRHPEKILAISARCHHDRGRKRLRLAFRDQGVGIPAEVLDKVLDPFFTTKPNGAGTGLGLSISHGILSDHGGSLHIESEAGAYTCVTVDLPAETPLLEEQESRECKTPEF